jgi:5-methylcytosine-specific restriction endonuclease McrA
VSPTRCCSLTTGSMSRRRTIEGKVLKKARKKGFCTWCGVAVAKPRIYWCSQKCVDEYLLRTSPSHARKLVWKRDRGICACCGVDASQVRTRMLRITHRFEGDRWSRRDIYDRIYRLTGWDSRRRTHWDADHIVEVRDGGGSCGLENFQTLCYRCHKKKTAARSRKSR